MSSIPIKKHDFGTFAKSYQNLSQEFQNVLSLWAEKLVLSQ